MRNEIKKMENELKTNVMNYLYNEVANGNTFHYYTQYVKCDEIVDLTLNNPQIINGKVYVDIHRYGEIETDLLSNFGLSILLDIANSIK